MEVATATYSPKAANYRFHRALLLVPVPPCRVDFSQLARLLSVPVGLIV